MGRSKHQRKGKERPEVGLSWTDREPRWYKEGQSLGTDNEREINRKGSVEKGRGESLKVIFLRGTPSLKQTDQVVT